jgi:hypothetical protein
MVTNGSRRTLLWLLLWALPIVHSLSGCTRPHYRRKADRQVAALVQEKSYDPRWALPPNFNIYPDPRSRYREIYNEDRPPMPEDDPDSHQYMHFVDNKRGWPHWHRYGERAYLENPAWQRRLAEYVPMTEDGEVELSVDTALRLAYIHSPALQQQLETIYLSAIDVSTERFRFDCQPFGGTGANFRHLGDRDLRDPITNAEIGRDSSILRNESDLQLQRQFAAGGTLLVDIANNFIWTFAGPNTNSTTSILTGRFIQPLLRDGGRAVGLERLTLVERGLLANLRSFERYRHGFYTNVAIGESGVGGPARQGGFFGGTGLTGFSGQGQGGLGGVGAATGFGRGFGGGGVGGGGGSGAGFAGGGAGQVGGFIGLLQQLQQIRNTEASLDLQLRTLSLLEANLEAGIIDLTQVDQFRQNIETERANLLQAQNNLTATIDSYLTGTLGLPPDVPVELDDQLIRQFQFIAPETTELQNAIAQLQTRVGEFPEEPVAEEVRQSLDTALELAERLGESFTSTDADLEALEDRSTQRERGMTAGEISLFARDRQQMRTAYEDLRGQFDLLGRRQMELVQALDSQAPRQVADDLVVWMRDLLTTVQGLALVQARARVEAVVIDPVDLEPLEAFSIALRNRLDIMNNRATLVDSWRLIEFNANRLRSFLDIELNGDILTPPDNKTPFNLHGAYGTLNARVRLDGPLNRLIERNNYRQQLIDYQRDRRQLIQFFDSVHLTMRQLLRRLNENRVNLEIQRRAVVIAVRRVDLTQEELNRPTAPPEPGEPASQLGPTAATNLLTALSDVRNAQNNFLSVYLNYYADQMRLARELGVMMLDEEGRWIELPLPGTSPAAEELPPLPPEVPREWLEDVFEADPDESQPLPPPTPTAIYQASHVQAAAESAKRR